MYGTSRLEAIIRAAGTGAAAGLVGAGVMVVAEKTYVHLKRHEEPLLWVSDAVAWCHQKGGPWIARAAPLVAEVRTL